MNLNKLRGITYLIFIAGMVTNLLAISSVFGQSAISTLSSQLCNVVTDVRSVIGVFALVLFIIGGVLYAAAHFLPAAGQIRGNLQGWSMGMIIGGIIGIILVIAAPAIVNIIVGFGNSQISGISGC